MSIHLAERDRQDQIVAEARRYQAQREQTYRAQALERGPRAPVDLQAVCRSPGDVAAQIIAVRVHYRRMD